MGGGKFKVTSISDYAFKNCKTLTKIIVPNTITSIGNNCFYNDEEVKITIRKYTGNIVDSLLENQNITYVYIGDAMASIGANAFKSVNTLKEVSMPDTVASVGMDAFLSKGSIKLIVRANDSILDEGLFSGNTVSINAQNNKKYKIVVKNAFDEVIKTAYKNTYKFMMPEEDIVISAEYVGYETGDVNLDGFVDNADSAIILRHTTGVGEITGELKLYLADINNDNLVDSNDAILCLSK